ncbi:MAG: SDR family NAD(P)-dependent oxidoreductase [Clostridiales bacterium]|nr:SDR family NAD(P)-dependent oxidoreductase [Clostridiales bacterium]
MNYLQMIFSFIWNNLTAFFGAVAAACFLACLVLLAAELMVYHNRKRQGGAGGDSGAGSQQGTVAVNQRDVKRQENAALDAGHRERRMRIALITGASSGMGSEFARCIDRTEKEIDEIWLVARRRERLEEAAGQLTHPAKVIPMDLTNAESIEELENLLKPVQVGIFVNCAGYAKIGNYEKVSRFDSDHMIDLNCKAAVNTTLAILPYMRAGDRILELCSTSSFQPVPHLNIYAAGKAFLYSYTRALRMELLPRGIVVTAVCPWWVADTEFLPTAKDNAANPDSEKSISGFLLPSKKEAVVRRALRTSRMGFAVSTPGIMCFLHRLFSKLIPRTGMIYLWEIMRRFG